MARGLPAPGRGGSDARGRGPLRVGVDARHLTGGRGVAHYTAAMLRALAEGSPDEEWRAFVPGSGPLVWGDAHPSLRIVRRRGPSRALFGAAAALGRPRLDRLLGDVDVVWLPAPAPVAVSPRVPYVLTVHDLSWLERPHDFTPYERAWHAAGRLRRLAAQAATVVAVSEATRTALARHWPEVRATVIRSGIPPLPPAGPPPPDLPDRYVLAVGALEPRKAPDLLARAAARAGVDVVFAGEGRLATQLAGARVLTNVDRPTLAALYDDALAVALPSHLEGFGFTPLEAARAGVPVVASDLPAVRETLQDAALTVPPGDEDAWTQALTRIAADAALRDTLSERGRERARAFDWDAAAHALRAILKDAA